MIVGMRRGANCVKPVSNVSMGEGESDWHRLEEPRAGILDKKEGQR